MVGHVNLARMVKSGKKSGNLKMSVCSKYTNSVQGERASCSCS